MESEAKIGGLFQTLRRARGTIITIVLVGTLLICVGPVLMPPKYTAKSQILIEPQGLMASQGSVIELPADEAAMQTEIAALTSPDLLQRMLDSLPSDPDFQAASKSISTPADSFVDDLWNRATEWAPRNWFTATGEPESINLRQLQRHLLVTQEAGSHVIGVSVTSISPEEAAAVANRLTHLYVEGQDQQKRASTDRTLAWLAQRAPELRDDVKRLDASVHEYRAAHNLAGSNPTQVSDGQIEDLNRQWAAAENDFTVAKAKVSLIHERLRKEGSIGAITDFSNSPGLTKLHEREIALVLLLASADANFVSGSPVMNKFRSELAEVRLQMTREAERVVLDLEQQVEIAAARAQALRERLATIRKDSTDITLSELEREAASSHRLYEGLLVRQEELREQRQSLSPGVRILSLAQPRLRPSSVNPILFFPPAAVLSFVFACFLAIGKAHFDRALRSETEVREVLGVPCIGLVPEVYHLQSARPHQYLLDHPFSTYAEAIRSIVAALTISRPDHDPKVLLFNSGGPGEGKTTLAVSLAVYLSKLGRRVILLDLDMRRPSVAIELGERVNGVRPRPLDEGRRLEDFIQPVQGLPLDFLAAPRGISDEPLSLFESSELSRLVQTLRARYDYVIIDSAPLLVIAESRLLTRLADKVVFVVEWGKTRRQVAVNALGLMLNRSFGDEIDGGNIVAVVSRVNLRKHARYDYGDSGEFLLAYRDYITGTKKIAS